jgi:hypothetical protein
MKLFITKKEESIKSGWMLLWMLPVQQAVAYEP